MQRFTFQMVDSNGYVYDNTDHQGEISEKHFHDGKYVTIEDLFTGHTYQVRTYEQFEEGLGLRVTTPETDQLEANRLQARSECREHNFLEEHDAFKATNTYTLGELTGKDKPASKRTMAEHVDPPHYQGYVGELQWLEAMQYLPEFHGEELVTAITLTIRGYMDRRGGKDDVKQEDLKTLWYMKFKTAYVLNDCNPIRVKDIDKILAGKGVVKVSYPAPQ